MPYQVRCTLRGYEVSVIGREKWERVIQEVYGPSVRGRANEVLRAIRVRNPYLAFTPISAYAPMPVNQVILFPPKERLAPQYTNTYHVRRALGEIAQHIDRIEELHGSGIELQLPYVRPLIVRTPKSKSGLTTWVRVKVTETPSSPPPPKEEDSFWSHFVSIGLNCGAAALGTAATVLSCGSTPFTAGASTPVCVASWVGTGATGAQCLLSVAKASSDTFNDYVNSDDGEWVNYVDIGLDFLSLGIGVASIPSALKAGSGAYKASKYTKFLKNVSKGKLIRTMAALEKRQKHLKELREMFEVGLKLTNPARKKALSNNIMKRMLPMVLKELNRQKMTHAASIIAATLSTVSSHFGGVGSKQWGIVRNVELEVYQFLQDQGLMDE